MSGLFPASTSGSKRINSSFNRAHISALIMAIALLTVLFTVLSTRYLSYVKGTIRHDSKSNLREMGQHIALNLKNEINSTTDVLGSLALETARADFSSEEELLDFLREQTVYWDFYDLSAIDADGISHHGDGRRDIPFDRSLLSEALKNETTVSDFQVVSGEDCMVFYTPLPPDDREATGILAISGAYSVRNWNTLMDIEIYDGQAVTHILTKNGVVVTYNDQKSGPSHYNYLEFLGQAELEKGFTAESVRQAMLDGEHLHITYQLDGIEYYLSCEPLGFNDWSLVYTVPASVVNSAGDRMVQSVLLLTACIATILVLLFIVLLLSQSYTRRMLRSMAYEDRVTGGDNKNKFELDARNLLEKGGRNYTLAYTNIEQFKMLNRRFGKAEGDFILRSLCQAMQRLTTDQECCARSLSDHFILLLEDNVPGLLEKRLQTFCDEQSIQKTSTGASCSICLRFGLCAVEDGTTDITQLIDRAELALKSLSRADKAITAVYDDSIMKKTERERELTELMMAENFQDELYICLQPKVDLHTGLVVGAEALARWQNDRFGPVTPGEFIPLAERAGLICRIDWFAFERVCRAISDWQKEGRELIPISFNLSKAQLSVPDFLDRYRKIIGYYQVPCQYLEFEFTESLLYENSGALQQAVSEIHEMGCLCSVDDFGFGYSSLGLLGQFEADTLKLDRSFFLSSAQPDSRNNRIVQSVIRLADSLGMKTVAEGVEDAEHVEMLKNFGCKAIQGYIFSKPLELSAFLEFVSERNQRGETDEPA